MQAQDLDSEEDDSDYNPNEDNDVSDDGMDAGDTQEEQITEFSKGRLKKADDLWRSMVEEDNRGVQEIMAKAVNRSVGGADRDSDGNSRKDKAKKAAIRKENIIAQIFGKKAARKMVSQVGSLSNALRGESVGVSEVKIKKRKGEDLSSEETKRRIQESVKKVMKKTTVLETTKFAGKEIRVEKTVYEGGAESKSSSSSSGNGGGLDSVLDTIKGPKTISTVTKSSMDWEVYKDKEGLEDDLAKASKEGYLTRKDFLERCDYRSFEMEREVRLKEQAARASAS